MSRNLYLPALLAMLVCSSCDDDIVAPPELSGAYVLETVDGRPLPFVQLSTALCEYEGTKNLVEIETISLKITILDGDNLLYEYANRERCTAQADSDWGPIGTAAIQMPYEYEGGRHEVWYRLPFTPWLSGTVQGTELSVSRGDHEYIFAKVP